MKNLIFVSMCLILAIPCQARTIYVDAHATGADDGSSWEDAFKYIQDAVSAASSGYEIWVAEGSYKPEQGIRITPDDFNGDDRANFANNSENGEHILTGSETVTTTEMIYWTTSSGRSIERSSLESPEIEVVLSGVNWTGAIALDMIDGRVYWTGAQPYGTYRANLDGTDVELLVGPSEPPLNNIALDLVAGKIYWTETGAFYKICRANLDGTDVEDLITTEILRRPNGIALDLAGGKIYWGEGVESQQEKGKIRRANLDGSAIEDLIEVGWNTFGLELDLGEGKMYWTNNNEGKVWRANLDGTNKELLIGGLDNPLGLTLDLTEGKLYCAEHHAGKIKRANLDGTEVEDFLVTDRFKVQGLALTIIPEVIVEVAVDIDPHTLNLQSEGKWINCHIWLPEDYNVADVNAYSVFLEFPEDEIGAEWIWANEQKRVLMTKFSRLAVQQVLSDMNDVLDTGQAELTVTGELMDGTRFEGADTIKVIDKGGKK